MNLTERFVQKQQATEVRQQFLDDDVKGFGLRIEPNGRKSFFWRRKVAGKVEMRALGAYPKTSVDDARTAAEELAGDLAEWKRMKFAGPNPFDRGQVDRKTVPTFKELFEAYIKGRVREHANRPAKAEANLRWLAEKHLQHWYDKKITEIRVEDVLAVKRRCGERKVTANRIVEFCRALFNWCAKEDDGKWNLYPLASNPAASVSRNKEKPRKRFLKSDELLRYNDALQMETHRDLADFLVLAINTGARKSDIFAMKWENIEWPRRIWTVPHPKNGDPYDVALLPTVMTVLERRRRESPNSDEYVFPGKGKTGHLLDLRKQWNAFRKAAGIADVHVHDIRRTLGSYVAMAGASQTLIAKVLGHKSIASAKVYAEMNDEALRQTVQAGQDKMIELMAAAEKQVKRTKTAPRKQLA